VSDRSDANTHFEFVRTTVDTFVKWDVVTYFHNNPHAADTAENIARVTGREAHEVETNLPDLVNAGVLESRAAGLTRLYCLTDTPDRRQEVAAFVAACADRDFRAQVIKKVIDVMGRAQRS